MSKVNYDNISNIKNLCPDVGGYDYGVIAVYDFIRDQIIKQAEKESAYKEDITIFKEVVSELTGESEMYYNSTEMLYKLGFVNDKNLHYMLHHDPTLWKEEVWAEEPQRLEIHILSAILQKIMSRESETHYLGDKYLEQ